MNRRIRFPEIEVLGAVCVLLWLVMPAAVAQTIVDNADNTAERKFEKLSGTWSSVASLPHVGSDYIYSSSSGAKGRWSCTGLSAGTYEVRVFWQQHVNRSNNVTYTVKDGATVRATLSRNQQTACGTPADPDSWDLLGTYDFGGGSHVVEVTNVAGNNLGADAVLFRPMGSLSTSTTTTTFATTTTSSTVSSPSSSSTTLPMSDLTVDNTDNTPQKQFQTLSGSWATANSLARVGSNYAYSSTTAARARWTGTVLPAGTYEVRVFWQQHANRSANVIYTVKDGTTSLGTQSRNQQTACGVPTDALTWDLLGTYRFSGGAHIVEVQNAASGNLGGDAVWFRAVNVATTTTMAAPTSTAWPTTSTTSTPSTSSSTTTSVASTTTTTLPPVDQDWDGGAGADTSWTTGLNWSSDYVPSGVSANVPMLNSGTTYTATLNTAAPDIVNLYVARDNAVNYTTLFISDCGSLTASGSAVFGAGRGSPTVGLSGDGSLFISGALTINAGGNFTGGTSTTSVGDSASLSAASISQAMRGSTAAFHQTGGEVVTRAVGNFTMACPDHATLAADTSAFYALSGGTLSVGGMLVMANNCTASNATSAPQALAVVTQTGGTATIGAGLSSAATALRIGNNSGAAYRGSAVASYQLRAGTLDVNGHVVLGAFQNADGTHSGCGTFELGDADGTGVFRQHGGPGGAARDLTVRASAASDGTLTGWGEVAFTGTLTNNGRVIANGFGNSRALDLSSFTSVTNSIENASGTVAQNDLINGWYAINTGKLVLPGVTVANGTGTFAYNLGESADDAEIDLVNSVRLTLTKAATAGDPKIACSLYDRGHMSVPPMENGFLVVGVWEIAPTFAIDTADLVFRYDSALAASMGVVESALKVFHYSASASAWVPLAGTVDTVHKRISAGGVTPFGFFAVAVAPYDLITDFGGDLFYKTYWGTLTVAPLGDGTSRITRSGGEEFTGAFVGKLFESARIHKNPAAYPAVGANYIPRATTVRYARVTAVESATSLIVDFEYNGGNDVAPQATAGTDGIFFANNKTALLNWASSPTRKREVRWNGVLGVWGLPNLTVTSDMAFKDLAGRKDNIYLKLMYSDDFNVSADGNSGCATWATQYGPQPQIFSFGNGRIDIDLPQILPTLYTMPSVQYVGADVNLFNDTVLNTSTATGTKRAYNWQQYKERDAMAAALGGVRSGASFNLPNLGYCMGGGTDDGVDVTAFNIYEVDGGWVSRSPMNFKARGRSGILFWVHGREGQRADFIEKESLKATSYGNIQTRFTSNRTCAVNDGLFTFYQMCNQYWLGGTGNSSTAPNEIRITVNGQPYTLYFGNLGDWRHEAQSNTISAVILDGQAARMFDRIPAPGDTVSLGVGNLGAFAAANVVRVWGWAMAVGTQLNIGGAAYNVIAVARTYTNSGIYGGGYAHYFDCTLDGAPAQVTQATVISSPLSALLDGSCRSATHLYNRDPNGHLCYTDQETNMRWQNVNFCGYVRCTGIYDGSNDLYKMTSIAEFTNVFCVNEDGTPRYSQGREYNPISLRRRQVLTGNSNYRVKISGGRMFWQRFTTDQPEVLFTNRPHLIYGTASYGEPRLLNPILGDSLGLVMGSGDGASAPVNAIGASIVFADNHHLDLRNSEIRGQLNLAGYGSVNLSNLTTVPIYGSPTQYHGCEIVGAINGFTIPVLNLTLTGDGGTSGFRQTTRYAIGSLVFNLTNWTLRPSYFNADGFVSAQDTADPNYGQYISVNGQVLY